MRIGIYQYLRLAAWRHFVSLVRAAQVEIAAERPPADKAALTAAVIAEMKRSVSRGAIACEIKRCYGLSNFPAARRP